MVITSVNLDRQTREALDALAIKQERSRSQIIRRLVRAAAQRSKLVIPASQDRNTN